MQIELTANQKKELESRHKKERDRRIADRIKFILLYSEGWTQVDISQALRICPETVHDHLKDLANSQKLKPENGGSQSRLTEEQTIAFVKHLEIHTYTKVSDIYRTGYLL